MCGFCGDADVIQGDAFIGRKYVSRKNTYMCSHVDGWREGIKEGRKEEWVEGRKKGWMDGRKEG